MSLRPAVVPCAVVLVCLWASCGRSLSTEALARSSYEYEAAPALPKVQEGVRVRPDVLRVSFSFAQEAEGLEQAVPKLKAAVDRYVRAAAGASKAEVSVRMRDFSGGGGSSRKVARGEEARVVGVLEVALPESLDFWGRAALVATLTQVGRQEAAAAEKAEGGLQAAFGFPEAQVRNPEAHRAELMKQWVERTRAFMAQAQSEQAPLRIANCEPPGEVKQQEESVDEVLLSLAVSCRLEAAGVK